MAKRSTILKNWPRRLMQWGALAALVAFVTGLIHIPDTSAVKAHCPEGWLQVVTGLALFASIMFLSRLFCGYLCPLGIFQDLMVRFRTRIRMKSIKVRNGSVADKILRMMKYILLFLMLTFALRTDRHFEPTLWVSITSACLLIVGCVAIDTFWCRYLCPLGAIVNSFKFWVWIAVLTGTYYIAGLLGLNIPWIYILGAFCIMGYLLEICHARPKLQIFHITKNEIPCNNCGACVKECPYHIELREFHNGKVNHVDCTLCGECVAACQSGALNVGIGNPTRSKAWRAVPLTLTILLAALAISAACIML